VATDVLRIVVDVLPEFLQPAEGKGQLQLAALIHGARGRFLNGKSNRHGNLLMCISLLAGRFPATVDGQSLPANRRVYECSPSIWLHNGLFAGVDSGGCREVSFEEVWNIIPRVRRA